MLKRGFCFAFLASHSLPELLSFLCVSYRQSPLLKDAFNQFTSQQVRLVSQWQIVGLILCCIYCLLVVFVQLRSRQDTQMKSSELRLIPLSTWGEFSLSSVSSCTLTRQFSVDSQNYAWRLSGFPHRHKHVQDTNSCTSADNSSISEPLIFLYECFGASRSFWLAESAGAWFSTKQLPRGQETEATTVSVVRVLLRG